MKKFISILVLVFMAFAPLASAYYVSDLLASQVLDVASVATNVCSAESTVTVTGAALGDNVEVAADTALEAGGFLFGKVTAADTVKWQFCNHTGLAIDRASDTYRIRVIRR